MVSPNNPNRAGDRVALAPPPLLSRRGLAGMSGCATFRHMDSKQNLVCPFRGIDVSVGNFGSLKSDTPGQPLSLLPIPCFVGSNQSIDSGQRIVCPART